jgi:hypothetical protein
VITLSPEKKEYFPQGIEKILLWEEKDSPQGKENSLSWEE